MTEFIDAKVEALETHWTQEHAKCQELEKQVRTTLKDLESFCAKIADSQKANDRALQDVHREVGQIEAAANQQRLTALLTAPDDEIVGRNTGKLSAKPTKRSGERAVARKPDDELRAAIERARTRGNRFNTARIGAWIKELEQAIRHGEHAMIDRGLAGLKAELTK
jgi:uncharacterized protein YeaO (DUF488 family)